MRLTIDYGLRQAELEVADGAFTTLPAPRAALADPAAAVRAAVEAPRDFPPLRRALTPDDQVAVLVDERLPGLARLLTPLLEHLLSAGLSPEAITLVCAPPSTEQPWLVDLPESLEEVRCEVHDPGHRQRLSFVTSIGEGRPLYFNRTAVDAAQVVVLAGRRYDTLAGYGGGEDFLYPTFADHAALQGAAVLLSLADPGTGDWPLQQQAAEAAWLLGVPFFVQVIEGAGDSVADVLAGVSTSLPEGRRRLDARWRRTVPQPVDTVVASLTGDPARHGLGDLADALTCAARVVEPDGRIVLLTDARPALGPAGELLTDAESPARAVEEFRRRRDLRLRAAWQWASVARRARIYLLSGLSGDAVEDLFATPLASIDEARRLLETSRSGLYLPDAHKTLAVIEEN